MHEGNVTMISIKKWSEKIKLLGPVPGTTDPMSSNTVAVVSALDVHNRNDQCDKTSFLAGAMKQCSCARARYSSLNYYRP